ncbi:ABC transporter ATP-binding protein [Microbacterium lacus]|uniref:ABC transporter domain-containing protein n=1 Tax=Microbacterium lacus TaxID=415217 RepID=A0ABN2HCK8_9MICO
MPEGHVLEFSGVTKRFGAVTAVSGLSARVEPGVVTGFLGPNGAGKTTSLRILLGLVGATSGTATIGGVPYAALERPLQSVGAVLEASSFHPGRTAANHLKVYAQAAGLPVRRVEETLGLVGLADVGGRKVGGFSLGMRQRLGLAYALLGDPGVLVLDEPANGLDPEGIKWMRGFLRELAHEGRTVFISSHLLAEVQQTVDSVLIIAQGRLVYQGALEDLADASEYATVVDAPDRAALTRALADAGIPFDVLRSGLTVRGADAAAIGAVAASAGVALSALQRKGPALEEVFLDLVSGARVHATMADAAPEAVAVAAAPAVAEPEPELPPVAEPEAGVPPVAEPESAASAEPAPVSTAIAVIPAAPAPAGPDPDDLDPAGAEEAAPPPVYQVAATGVIDIIPAAGNPATDAFADDRPLDADADVEALGEIDDELEAAPNDRPWETYVKTDADREADAFFAAFDPHAEAGDDPRPDDEGGAQR